MSTIGGLTQLYVLTVCMCPCDVDGRRLIPVRKDIEVVGGKMTKHAEECGQHLQAQNTVCYTHSDNSHAYSASIELVVYVGACLYCVVGLTRS